MQLMSSRLRCTAPLLKDVPTSSVSFVEGDPVARLKGLHHLGEMALVFDPDRSRHGPNLLSFIYASLTLMTALMTLMTALSPNGSHDTVPCVASRPEANSVPVAH
jgi:hypothetical protein